MKTVIIGGGPAGMMSAISAAENRSPKDEVIIVEKMNMLGKKLLITGKGRCNITSSLEMEDFIKIHQEMECSYIAVFNNLQTKI